MVVDIKAKCPRIDMFVLCFEQGKFDTGIQTMMQTYENLLDQGQSMWHNMTCVVTKVGWNDDYDEMKDWTDEMEMWKENLAKLIHQKYQGAEPMIVAISQDITKPRREENKPGTEQNTLMQSQMALIYTKAASKFSNDDFLDLSNLKYVMAPETYRKWLESKSVCKKLFNEELQSVVSKDHVKGLFLTIMAQHLQPMLKEKGQYTF